MPTSPAVSPSPLPRPRAARSPSARRSPGALLVVLLAAIALGVAGCAAEAEPGDLPIASENALAAPDDDDGETTGRAQSASSSVTLDRSGSLSFYWSSARGSPDREAKRRARDQATATCQWIRQGLAGFKVKSISQSTLSCFIPGCADRLVTVSYKYACR